MKIKRSLAILVSHLCLGAGIIGLFFTFLLTGMQGVALAASTPAFVRVIHASPFVGTANVFVDGKELLSSFEFGAVTGYVAVPEGPHKVQIALVGKGIGASVITQTLAVSPGLAYTVAATGASANDLGLTVFIDNNLLSAGTAKLRVYQLSPDVGSINIDSNEKLLLSGLGYKQASSYLSLAAGTYNIGCDSTTVSANLTATTTLGMNKVTSLFVLGLYNGTPKLGLVSSEVPGLPKLPNTGSDPNALPAVDTGSHPVPWILALGICSLLLIGCWGFLRYRVEKY